MSCPLREHARYAGVSDHGVTHGSPAIGFAGLHMPAPVQGESHRSGRCSSSTQISAWSSPSHRLLRHAIIESGCITEVQRDGVPSAPLV
jgi:hypothetical protein